MKTVKKLLFFVLPVLTLIAVFSCKKDKGDSPGNSDEAAAGRVVGTYKGTIEVSSHEYFNAIIVVTKESGNKVKVAPKAGQDYSNITAKIFPIKAISNSNDAEVIGYPEGAVLYQHSDGSLTVTTLATAAGDVTYNFSGTKQ